MYTYEDDIPAKDKPEELKEEKFYQHNRTVSYGIIDVSLGRRFVAFFFLIRDDSMITMI